MADARTTSRGEEVYPRSHSHPRAADDVPRGVDHDERRVHPRPRSNVGIGASRPSSLASGPRNLRRRGVRAMPMAMTSRRRRSSRRTRPSSTPRTTGSPTGSRVTFPGPRGGNSGTRATRAPARSRRWSASPAATATPTDRPRTRARRRPRPRTGPTSTAATPTTTCTSSRTT